MISRRLIRIKVLQVLYAYTKREDGFSSHTAEKELFHSIEKFYDLYLLMLLLGVEMAGLEKDRIEMRRNKKIPTKEDMSPSTRLSENRFISLINSNSQLAQLQNNRKLNWKIYHETVKRIYQELIETPLYLNYIDNEDESWNADRKFLIRFYSDFLSDNHHFIDFLEEENIYWNDDSSFAIMMVIKTLENFKAQNPALNILPLYKNDDDKEFAKKLLRTTIVKKQEHLQIIGENTQNWETERIAQVDLLILQMAISELFEFNSIPVKVTLDEFIEISKYYSTDKSKVFINGVLDNVIKQLEKSGRIKKTGRGLIDQ